MAFQPLTKEQYQKAIDSGFTPNKIIEMEKTRKASNVEKIPNYFSRVSQEYTKAGKDIISGIQEGATQMEKGDILGGMKTSALRTVGGVAGATFAPITEAPIIKPTLEAAGTAISKIPGVDLIIQKATELAKKYPEQAKDLQNIIDIATIGVGKEVQKPLATAFEKSGVALEKSGVISMDLAKKKFAEELVLPIESKATKLSQVGRTLESGGFFKKDIVVPTKFETKTAEEVAKIPGISPKNTFQKNFNIVRDYNLGQAQQLESEIAQYNFIVPKKKVISELDKATKLLKNHPLIIGDAEKTANRLIKKAQELVNSSDGSGSGLLKVRKEYDNWILSQKPKAFDAKAENAFTIANKTVRDTLNNVLDENATNLGIKDSLRKQFALYSAMENIAPKAAQEANTPLLRALERVGKVVGTKSRIVQGIAMAAGIGGLGAAATFAPAVAVLGGTGLIVYKAGKLVMSPEVRIALGKLLQTSGHLMNPEDKKIIQEAITQYGNSK